MRNIDNQAADGKDAPARVAEIGKLLEQAKLELREAENAREAAKAQLAADKGQSSAGLATSSLLPLEKNSGPPHSSVSMCATGVQITEW